jgi:hypothetical protein
MLEHFWYAVGWTMGWAIVAGFQVFIWAIDVRHAAQDSWRRVNQTPLPLLDSRPE